MISFVQLECMRKPCHRRQLTDTITMDTYSEQRFSFPKWKLQACVEIHVRSIQILSPSK